MEKNKIVELRRANLKKWFADKTVPTEEKSYVSQLIGGSASFGEKAARRLETAFQRPLGYLINPEADNLAIAPTNKVSNEIHIPLFDVSFGMGQGAFQPKRTAAGRIKKAATKTNTPIKNTAIETLK